MSTETIISIFLGIGLAASVGFRVFVPLFALSLAAHFNIIPLNESWQWVSSFTALFTLGIATLLEIFAYYIPWFDHLLDTISIPLAAIAGTAVVVSTAANLDPTITWALAIIAGGGTAAAVSSSTAATRVTSTATTGGFGNPVVATAEAGAATALSALSIFAPIIAIVIVVVLLIAMVLFFKKIVKIFKKNTQ